MKVVMIPGVNLIDFINWGGILAVSFIIFAESGLLIGFFLPGDSLLFTTGYLIQAEILKFDINLAVLIIFIAAVTGDSVGYLFGRKTGPRIFNKSDAKLFKQEYVTSAHAFYEKHGGKTIVLARFIPIIRTFAPIVAGAAKMNYKQFVTYNLIGGLIWAVGITYAGFWLGKWFERMGWEVDQILLPFLAFIVLTSILPPLIHIFKDKKRRLAFWNGAKRELASLFKKS